MIRIVLTAVTLLAVFVSRAGATDDDLLDLYSDVEQQVSVPGPGAANAGVADDFAQRIQVTVDNVRNAHGTVHVLVFDDATAYAVGDPTRAVGYVAVAAARGSVSATVATHGTGPFALFAYHDENQDSRLNIQAGRPLEGYAYSGAVDPYLPPDFGRAAIVTDEARVQLVYIESRMRR